MQEHYTPQTIEPDIQNLWEKQHCFNVSEDPTKEKFYSLSMFPYPSGKLHMGHVRNYTISDVIARYQRMLGKNVLQPMGWDAFGLPAENAAIKNGVAPAKWTYANIVEMRKQFKLLGMAFDWQREIATCTPDYYRWEQWLFTQLFAKGLVYKKNAVVNWDPVDQTILANEQVINGCGWRSGASVERREIAQWFLKITAYADELLADIDKLEQWPQEVRTMQRNWIGRSAGSVIRFQVNDADHTALEVFTTRADTLFGATYLAIAPQHPLALQAAQHNQDLAKFIEECRAIPTAEAVVATLEKRGMDTNLKAINPINGEQIPIWIANFVLMEYGSGAVMSVPAHDERDHEFAKQYNLPVKQVIKTKDGMTHDFAKTAYTEYGTLINSRKFDGLSSEIAIQTITEELSKKNSGYRKINYRLRDWSISRQRYWGTPVPIVYCDDCDAVAVPAEQLPVILPEAVQFSGAASPLKNMPEFYQTTCPQCHKPARRETDTFDTFIESSWYYARYASFDQHEKMLDERANYWLPVDQYVGGIEHAVMHLLYARFFHKLMRDCGLVKNDEPFTRLLTQGMVLKDGAKMSKSIGNTVDPQAMIEKYGADTARLFTMFAAPPEQSLEWSDSGVEGAYRFLKRLWTFAFTQQQTIREYAKQYITQTELTSSQQKIRRELHEIIRQCDFDMQRQQFNTIVSGSMKILNLLQTASSELTALTGIEQTMQATILAEGFTILLRLLAPIVPHITQQLWQDLGMHGLIIDAAWPVANPEALQNDQMTLVVQINGKLRGHIVISADSDDQAIQQAVVNDANIKAHLQNKMIKKTVIVPGKLVNLVVV